MKVGERPDALLRVAPQLRIEILETERTKFYAASLLGELSGISVDSELTHALMELRPGTSRQSVVQQLAYSLNLTSDDAKSLENQLEQRGVLVEADCQDDRASEFAHWQASGWRSAAQYHFHTYGYPFESYDERGTSQIDGLGMLKYAKEAADTDRALRRADKVAASPVPDFESVSTPAVSTHAALAGDVPPCALSGDLLDSLLRYSITQTASLRLPWPGSAPLLRKVAPSGGSRHPTETYVATWGVDGWRDGWCHIEHSEGVKELLAAPTTAARACLTLDADQDQSGALILFTSRFARNRYRYREPRTFRTVHMDVGHLLGTAELWAAGSGLRAVPNHLGTTTGDLADELSLAALEEWPIAGLEIRGALI